MKAVTQLGIQPHRSHTHLRSASAALTPAGKDAGRTASFSDLTLAAMQHLPGRQEVRSVIGNSEPKAGANLPTAARAHPVHCVGMTAQSSIDGKSGAAAYGRYIGHPVGSGQCVALVHTLSPGIGRTAGWAPGARVKGNLSLQPGTAIATFDKSGRYANATDGSSHAAIYLGQNEQGVQVLDQWAGNPAAVRTIAWTNPNGAAANTGSALRVVRAG